MRVQFYWFSLSIYAFLRYFHFSKFSASQIVSSMKFYECSFLPKSCDFFPLSVSRKTEDSSLYVKCSKLVMKIRDHGKETLIQDSEIKQVRHCCTLWRHSWTKPQLLFSSWMSLIPVRHLQGLWDRTQAKVHPLTSNSSRVKTFWNHTSGNWIICFPHEHPRLVLNLNLIYCSWTFTKILTLEIEHW